MVKRDAITSFWRITGPHPTVLVTTISKEAKPNIITVAWVVPLSIRPPLLAIGIGKTRYSHALLEETGEFVVNVPPQELMEKVEFCGSVSGRNVDKFEKAGLTPSPAKKVKPPIIEECIGHIECRVVNPISTGDHTLFIGEVLAAYADEELYTNMWEVQKAKPLLHVGGDTFTVPAEPIIIK